MSQMQIALADYLIKRLSICVHVLSELKHVFC